MREFIWKTCKLEADRAYKFLPPRKPIRLRAAKFREVKIFFPIAFIKNDLLMN